MSSQAKEIGKAGHGEHCPHGPGYESPLAAMKEGPKETILYVTCIAAEVGSQKKDYLATIDVDPKSPTYSQVIHRLYMPTSGDELHHSGWNSCSSCYTDTSKCRRYLILPGLVSGRVHIVDTVDPKNPKLIKTIEADEIKKTGLSYPHTVHCSPTGEVMISCMGTPEGEGEGGFILLDDNFNVKGRWEKDAKGVQFGYDFWYQPRHNVMVSSEWGAPKAWKGGFNPNHLAEGKYGRSIHVWDWKEHKHLKTIDLGEAGMMPLEVRFLHNPEKAEGYVASALGSSLFRFFKEGETWNAEKVLSIPQKEVEGWALPSMPSLMTDFMISLDDRYLYLSNWLHGDIRQYDITDTRNPKLVGQVYVGGAIRKGRSVRLKDGSAPPDVPSVKGVTLEGGPQMLQLSLDGKRLYVTNSLESVWDAQFYPDLKRNGSYLLQIFVDTEKGGLTLNENFIVDFGKEPQGPALAHEMRYPGGDCTSDIWT